MNVGKNLHGGAVVYALARLGLGAIFIYAALVKMAAPQDFADALASYHLLPPSMINPVALSFPPFELSCGVLLFTRHFCAAGLLSIISLLGLFLAALLWALVRNLPVNCGCFGASSFLDFGPAPSFVRDGALLIGAILAYRHELRRRASIMEAARHIDQKPSRTSTD